MATSMTAWLTCNRILNEDVSMEGTFEREEILNQGEFFHSVTYSNSELGPDLPNYLIGEAFTLIFRIFPSSKFPPNMLSLYNSYLFGHLSVHHC